MNKSTKKASEQTESKEKMGVHVYRRKHGRRGWLDKILDPDGTEENLSINADNAKRVEWQRKHSANWLGLSRTVKIAWIAEKIRARYDKRRVILEFCKTFGLEGVAGKKKAEGYLRELYEDIQKDYGEEGRKNLLAEHAEALKEASRRAIAAGEFTAAEKLFRQYAETVGVLAPPSMLKIHQENTQQNILADPTVMNTTLAAMEKLNAQDIFEHLFDGRSREANQERKGVPALTDEGGVGLINTGAKAVVSGGKEKV